MSNLRAALRNLSTGVAMANAKAKQLVVGRPVKILTGPYAGYMAKTCRATVNYDVVWIDVYDIVRRDGRGFIDFATRKDGRIPYTVDQLEFMDTENDE